MKTISGKLISSKPISLSKAAKILSAFAGHDNGASDAVSVYLRRAADSFNGLVGFHKDLKNQHSIRKHQASLVKIEENSDAAQVESKGKSKKNPDFKVKIVEPLEVELKPELGFRGEDEKELKNKRKGEKDRQKSVKIEQFDDGEGEKVEEKNHSKGRVKIEDTEQAALDEAGEKRNKKKHREEVEEEKHSMGRVKIEDTDQAALNEAGEERNKKKHKKLKTNNEEPIKIEQNSYRDSGGAETQVLDEDGKEKIDKQERAGIKQHADETEEDSVKKREKQKRKKSDGEEAGHERKDMDVDGVETVDLSEQSGKKKRKRRKTEGD